ncbi:hypothetical protein MMAGJ_07340 [Mycolicibacterium mageritense]|uniref:Uncharacterized protein n=1 Tax=Mycolicibacterium mageritense TaxID=53462 RepID=A0ABM7HLR8_MYCME|nr:hypothetical protein MMAGJ_07340 [Mycolicibacterium mageritense]
MAIIRVPGVRFGFEYGCQPGGVGIVTVRSGIFSGATGSPTTPMLSRKTEMGTGASVLVGAVVVALVVQIDW